MEQRLEQNYIDFSNRLNKFFEQNSVLNKDMVLLKFKLCFADIGPYMIKYELSKMIGVYRKCLESMMQDDEYSSNFANNIEQEYKAMKYVYDHYLEENDNNDSIITI